ncbi:methionine adenosyltransferase [Candidatus Falkowbacteria bacterium]|nr:methionine adenosyltransferase [Candidatus Falkowbacteria bacterium]
MRNEMDMRKARSMAAEFVTNGHPDKCCDQMADAIVDTALSQDPKSRVAMEVTGGHGGIVVIGEMTTCAVFDIGEVVRRTYRAIGHDHDLAIFTNVVKQAKNIAQGVDDEKAVGKGHAEQGAGDQGIMVGYAVNDTPEFMPLTWSIAKRLCLMMHDLRVDGTLPWLRPDGKSQVTIVDGKITHVTLAAHHALKFSPDTPEEKAELAQIRIELFNRIVRPVVPDLGNVDMVAAGEDPCVVINGTGRFVQGGFDADAGTTGRKLMVDNFGPNVEIGGGCYSGKDPTKVDRSAAYFCRFIAKSIVAGGYAREAIVKVGYAIGVAKPTYVSVQTSLPDDEARKLEANVLDKFDFRPKAIIERLGLIDSNKDWRYEDTARFGHYGDSRFPWETPVSF